MGEHAGSGSDYVAMLAAFARALRDEGLGVGSGHVITYSEAVAALDPTDLVDLYWAGRTTLVSRRDQVRTYHRVFERFFLDDGTGDRAPATPFTPEQRTEARSMLEVPETEGRGAERDRQEARLGLVASGARTSRHKDFAACTPDELAALRRILRTLRLTPPRRRSRRRVPARRGAPDVRRTVRETMRRHGEPAHPRWRGRRLRHRPLVLILDVSGSMADYSRHLLQFAHTSSRSSARTEVFCFGTRLTRITRELDRRRPDDALDRAAAAVLDWDGGTRIGDALDRFVRDHARRGVARGGIVVICSDGLDRGDPEVLERAMERLTRLCHRIVWLNPHRGEARDWAPSTLGMMVAAPYVDELLAGHDLASLETFARTLARMR